MPPAVESGNLTIKYVAESFDIGSYFAIVWGMSKFVEAMIEDEMCTRMH